MYNDNDELYEFDDMGADIEYRKELIEQAKQLDFSDDADWVSVSREFNRINRKFKKVHDWESKEEQEMIDEFESIADQFYAKRKLQEKANKEAKETLIEDAKAVNAQQRKDLKEWNQANDKIKELFDEWKKIGHVNKEEDDALWEAFNGERQAFFEARKGFYNELKEKRAQALETKKELIEKAKGLADSQNWQKTSNEFKALMEEWKAAGSAGKNNEDALWEEFNGYRQTFYSNRNAYYDELHAQQQSCYEAKKVLISEAREILETQQFTKDNTEKMKQLNVSWKEAGFCGKEREDRIWKEFRTVMDQYFAGLKEWNAQKHEQWRTWKLDAKARKQEMIQNQKRQINRLRQDMVGLIGERAIMETQRQIEEKEDFIARLQSEIDDIDNQLNEDTQVSQVKPSEAE